MGKEKVIAVASLKGGVGKSTLVRVLALFTKSVMLNLDDKRKAKNYSSDEIIQQDISAEVTVCNTEKGVLVGNRTIRKIGEFVFLDFGGVYDKRIPLCLADFYIIPLLGDNESINEGRKTALFIKQYNPTAQILFIFNMFAERSKDRINEQRAEIREILNKSGFESCTLLDLPYNALYPKLTTKKLSLTSLLKQPLEAFRLKKFFMPKIDEIIEIIRG